MHFYGVDDLHMNPRSEGGMDMSVMDERHLNESIPLLGFVGGMGVFAAAMIILLLLGTVTL